MTTHPDWITPEYEERSRLLARLEAVEKELEISRSTAPPVANVLGPYDFSEDMRVAAGKIFSAILDEKIPPDPHSPMGEGYGLIYNIIHSELYPKIEALQVRNTELVAFFTEMEKFLSVFVRLEKLISAAARNNAVHGGV